MHARTHTHTHTVLYQLPFGQLWQSLYPPPPPPLHGPLQHDSKRSAESIQFASASSASFGSSSSHSTAAAGSALEMPGSGASDGTAAAGSTLERPTSGVSSGGGAPGGGAPGGSAPGEAQRASGGKGRTFSSRCWLAKHYPITLAQVGRALPWGFGWGGVGV